MRPFNELCTWCFPHLVHDGPCARSIQTSGGKKPAEAPCPCRRHLSTTSLSEIPTGSPTPTNPPGSPDTSPD